MGSLERIPSCDEFEDLAAIEATAAALAASPRRSQSFHYDEDEAGRFSQTSTTSSTGVAGSNHSRSSSRLPGKSFDGNALQFYQEHRRRSRGSGTAAHQRRSNSQDEPANKPPTLQAGISPSPFLQRQKGVSSASTGEMSRSTTRHRKQSRIYDDPAVIAAYRSIPLLEMQRLPRGGVSIETSSVGRIQFGIPPETIKDSMRLGLDVPRVYIVPVDRFCREMGPALGINMAEFEFPAYFNWFVRRKRCTLVVDSKEAERNIRNVFEETLLGPHEFRDKQAPKAWDKEDFDPSFPEEARPNFYKEFQHFRTAEKNDKYDELTIDMLVDFCHFNGNDHSFDSDALIGSGKNESIGVPLIQSTEGEDEVEEDYTSPLHASIANFDWGNHPDQGLEQDEPRHHSATSFPAPTSLSRATTEPFPRPDTVHDESGGNQPGRRMSEDSCDSVEGSLASLRSSSTASVPGGEDGRAWMFSQVKWLAEVATVWPANATPDQIRDRSVPRVEIFKMPGGVEYVIHEVDENNYIIGKARISGTVDVPDEMAVEGFLDSDVATSLAREKEHQGPEVPVEASGLRAGFYPPSFGITILGNSHGFDKNGSTSGYVIWINGRGVMVDPPPYSSATLEREGIRPQTIIAIIITHCHADHDAGAFQKVLTGSRVSIITAPSIYKSFIRKYSALSGLSPSYLRRSHCFRPAIIGQPLRFQGATFHFGFTLHTIPCLALRVEWRGRSVVFTGDHLNLPPLIQELTDSGVLSNGRADSLRHISLQECDILLHEAGAPPIHTPLSVLQNLPAEVKNRLYVVHTSALPPDCGLRVAPVGTAGTLRLDERASLVPWDHRIAIDRNPFLPAPALGDDGTLDDGGNKNLGVVGTFTAPTLSELKLAGLSGNDVPPLVFQRPTCVSDAWFMLNLLSKVPFFSSLSYVNTMEVLEIAKVEVFCAGDVVVESRARREVLCLVWEGTCAERDPDNPSRDLKMTGSLLRAGDWTGPTALLPKEEDAGGKPNLSRDLVAVSPEGVKVISIAMTELEKILRRGSQLYRKYLTLLRKQVADEAAGKIRARSDPGESGSFFAYDHILDILQCNSVLGRLPALQKRSLESIAEGPRVFEPGTPLWRLSDRCEYAFLIVAGTATFETVQTSKMRSTRVRRGSVGVMVEIADGRFLEVDKLMHHVDPNSEYARLETLLELRTEQMSTPRRNSRERSVASLDKSQMGRDRFANKVLSRLYSGRKYMGRLMFGRGCFLSDTSRMVSGELVHETVDGVQNTEQHLHSSTMVAGNGGCVALIFPRSAFVAFLDANPGTLLCLLGTQAVV